MQCFVQVRPHHTTLAVTAATHRHHHPVGLGERAGRQREGDAQAQEPAGRDKQRAARDHAQQRKQQLAGQGAAVALEPRDVLHGSMAGAERIKPRARPALGTSGGGGSAAAAAQQALGPRRPLAPLVRAHLVMLQALRLAAARRCRLGQQAGALSLQLQGLEACWHGDRSAGLTACCLGVRTALGG